MVSDARLSVPQKFRRGSLRHDERASVRSAMAILDLLDGEKPLKGSRILDFGCGVKLAQALVERDDPQAFYMGMDVYGGMIDWLNDALAENDKYHFETVRFQNDMYNKDGEKMTRNSVLPGSARKYDFICMFSVITHMSPEDASAIFHILHRQIEDDGVFIFSTFVDPKQTVDFFDEDPERPLLRAHFKQSFLEKLLVEASWTIKRFGRPIKGVIQSHYICTRQA